MEPTGQPRGDTRATVCFDSALREGKLLFRNLRGIRWRTSLIDQEVDDRDWVLPETSGDLNHYFMMTGGAVDKLQALIRDREGARLGQDIAEAWSIAYLTTGVLEESHREGGDISAYRGRWTRLVALTQWSCDAIRSRPEPAVVPLIRTTAFLKASVEEILVGHLSDPTSRSVLDFRDPSAGWLRSGMMLAGLPHLELASGFIPDRVLPDLGVVARVRLRDAAGEVVPSVPRSRPSPCPACWEYRGRDHSPMCNLGCDEGDRGALPGPLETRFGDLPDSWNEVRGPAVARFVLGGLQKIETSYSVSIPAERDRLASWLEARVAGRRGGRPAAPTAALQEFLVDYAKAALRAWGQHRSDRPPVTDESLAAEFNERSDPADSRRRVTPGMVRHARRKAGIRLQSGRLRLPRRRVETSQNPP